MKRRILVCPILLLLTTSCLCFPVFIFAETIILKSGKIIEGKIIERTDKYVKIDFYGVALTYFLDEIQNIGEQEAERLSKPTTSPTVPEQEKSPAQIFEEAAPAIVVITAQLSNGTSQGSGFIVDKNGVVVTNFHVVAGAENIDVKLRNGERFPVTGIVAYDPRLDICILKIDAQNLKNLSLGDSDSLAPGQKVLVVGAPLGLEYSISDGLLSGKRLTFYQDTLQFSAPISPGNSGGPLLDMQGRVVGVVTYTRIEGQNINFAVSINQAKKLISAFSKISMKDFRLSIGDDYLPCLLGSAAEANGNYEEAFKYYKEGLKGCSQPYSKECLWRILDFIRLGVNRGSLYLQAGNYSQTTYYCKECTDIIESFGGPEYLIDEIQKDMDWREERLNRHKENTIGQCYFYLGLVSLYNNNDKVSAFHYVEKLKNFAPESASLLAQAIDAYEILPGKELKKGDLVFGDRSEKEYMSPADGIDMNKFMAGLDEETARLCQLGAGAFTQGEYRLALEYMDKAIRRAPKQSTEHNIILRFLVDAHVNVGRDYSNKRFFDDAIEYFERALFLIGDSKDSYLKQQQAECYFNLGTTYYQQGDIPKAQEYIKRLRSMNTAYANRCAGDLDKSIQK